MKDEPAFPNWVLNSGTVAGGLTKREYFAAMAMQGAMANPNLVGISEDGTAYNRADNQIYALECADALIAELEKEPRVIIGPKNSGVSEEDLNESLS